MQTTGIPKVLATVQYHCITGKGQNSVSLLKGLQCQTVSAGALPYCYLQAAVGKRRISVKFEQEIPRSSLWLKPLWNETTELRTGGSGLALAGSSAQTHPTVDPTVGLYRCSSQKPPVALCRSLWFYDSMWLQERKWRSGCCSWRRLNSSNEATAAIWFLSSSGIFQLFQLWMN